MKNESSVKITPEKMRKRCEMILTSLVGDDLVDDWWQSSNRAFQMQTPEDVYKTEPEKVYNYLLSCASRP